MQPLERLARGIYWDERPSGGVLFLPERPEGPGLAVELEIVINERGARAWWWLEGNVLLRRVAIGDA